MLTGPAIAHAIASGEISFDPFDPARLNPNSIDIRLGGAITEIGDGVIDAKAPPQGRESFIPEAGLVLEPGKLYLARSLELFGSNFYAPIVHGRSNIARAGLFIHANGEMVDLGVVDHFDFQLVPILPIRVHAGMAIGQVTFWSVVR